MLIGHSGAKLKLITTSNGYLVKKSGSSRLKKQMQKQKEFQKLIKNDKILNLFFHVPEVIEDDDTSFTMSFVNGKSILDIFEKSDIVSLNTILERLLYFLEFELKQSKRTHFPVTEFLEKLNSIKEKISKKHVRLVTEFQFILSSHKKIWIPVGLCHGDLTFSNLIFTDKIVLIDFCDTFVESPLQDLAKILQESKLEWSYLIDSNRDETKIKIGYDYFNKKLQEKLTSLMNDYRIDLKTVYIFYVMVLFRVLPYTKSKLIENKVLNEITNLIYEMRKMQ